MEELEERRPVVGFERLYEVSSLGRVRSLGRIRIRKAQDGSLIEALMPPKIMATGKLDRTTLRKVPLSGQNGVIQSTLPSIVCEAFHGPAPEGCKPMHLDADRLNNRAANLRWATNLEAKANAIRCGKRRTAKPGKLTEEEAYAIRASSETGTKLAALYGVSTGVISRIRGGFIWPLPEQASHPAMARRSSART